MVIFVCVRGFSARRWFGLLLRRGLQSSAVFGFLVRLTFTRRGVDVVRRRLLSRCFDFVILLLLRREFTPFGSEKLHDVCRGELFEFRHALSTLFGTEDQIASGLSCSFVFLFRRFGTLVSFLLR